MINDDYRKSIDQIRLVLQSKKKKKKKKKKKSKKNFSFSKKWFLYFFSNSYLLISINSGNFEVKNQGNTMKTSKYYIYCLIINLFLK